MARGPAPAALPGRTAISNTLQDEAHQETGEEGRPGQTKAAPGERRRNVSVQIAADIMGLIAARRMAPGHHLPTQELADRFRVSRWPIQEALKILAAKGVARYERNRGYFVCDTSSDPESLGLRPQHSARAYFQLATDYFEGALDDQVSETYLRQRYNLTRGQLAELLTRINREGWAERRTGYGWTFAKVLRTPEALRKSYEFRIAIEPASLLVPNYDLPMEEIERCLAVENELLSADIETIPADSLYEKNMHFHETIVAASNNHFFLESLRSINRLRRLFAYKTMSKRIGYYRQHYEHRLILGLLAERRQQEASDALRQHLIDALNRLKEAHALDI